MASNQEVFRAFAAGEECDGGNVRSKFMGPALVLWSYAEAIAYRTLSGYAFTDRDFSVTTRKQKSQAQRAVGEGGYAVLPDNLFVEGLKAADPTYLGRHR